MYDFDKVIDRKNTNSLKYDFAEERNCPIDALPLWVADMDFQAPKEVVEALVRAAEHGIFGYTEMKEPYYQAVSNWFETHFNWQTKPEWLIKTPGVVFAIVTAIRAFTKEGDGIMLQRPVYYPFEQSIILNHRKPVNNALRYENGTYSIDFGDMERKIIENNVSLFLLCSPHNPVGRVWTKEELNQIADICLKHEVLVVSDEIHCDFTYSGCEHTILASLNEKISENSIICTAPSKTFNLAGLQNSNIFIPNQHIRKKFQEESYASGYSQLNTMGLYASQAAYMHGEPWLTELKVYIEENLKFVREFSQKEMPLVRLIEPQGTYLIWLDCKELGYSDKELNDKVLHKAKLWLDGGSMFGIEGDGFQRMNIACPRSVLKEAMERFKKIL